MKDFLVIAITPPFFFLGEEKRINDILKNNEADFVHIRKPDCSIEDMENLIHGIDEKVLKRVKIHDHFELVNKYDLGGCHLNSRNPFPPHNCQAISRSVHSWEEIENEESYDYYFISPIFDSISKKGYNSKFNLKEIKDKGIKGKAIALGGVTPDRFPSLRNAGFSGAAMLSYFFPQEEFLDKN